MAALFERLRHTLANHRSEGCVDHRLREAYGLGRELLSSNELGRVRRACAKNRWSFGDFLRLSRVANAAYVLRDPPLACPKSRKNQRRRVRRVPHLVQTAPTALMGRSSTAIREAEAKYAEGLDPERQGFGVLASRWYPAELVHDLLDRLMARRDRRPSSTRWRSTRPISSWDARSKWIYRTMFSMFVTPERYVKYINNLWDDALRHRGTIVVRAPEPTGVHRITYSEWAGHHPFICRMNMASGYAIYAAMGCKGVTCQRIRCVSDGAADCESMVRWVK